GAPATARLPTAVILCPWRRRGCLWFSGIGQASASRSTILRHSGSWVGRQVSTARYSRRHGCPLRQRNPLFPARWTVLSGRILRGRTDCFRNGPTTSSPWPASRAARAFGYRTNRRNSLGLLWAVDVLLYPRSLLVSFPALVGIAAPRAAQLLAGALGCAPVLDGSEPPQKTASRNSPTPGRQRASSSARILRLLS